jgi:hypothetical protein
MAKVVCFNLSRAIISLVQLPDPGRVHVKSDDGSPGARKRDRHR